MATSPTAPDDMGPATDTAGTHDRFDTDADAPSPPYRPGKGPYRTSAYPNAAGPTTASAAGWMWACGLWANRRRAEWICQEADGS